MISTQRARVCSNLLVDMPVIGEKFGNDLPQINYRPRLTRID